MNTWEHKTVKERGDPDVSYLGHTVDEMIGQFMLERDIPGLALAIVQAPYITRVVGYGLSDKAEKRLSAVNTMWPIGPISQGYAAVAVMQLAEDGRLNLYDSARRYLPELPENWGGITVLELLRHSSGLPDYRLNGGWTADTDSDFADLIAPIYNQPPRFEPGENVQLSATNFLLLSEIVERASGMPYRDFIRKRQIDYLGLRHTGFFEELDRFPHEDVAKTGNTHQLFKSDKNYIDPTEPATGYDKNGSETPPPRSSALRDFSDLWASAYDVSLWDIALAGSVLVSSPENRALLYGPWRLPDGHEAPESAGWLFYKHPGLMDIKGSVPGFSAFLSRFTDPDELVCVTLLANKEDVDFTNLGRRIAGAFGSSLGTNYDDNRLFLFESQFSVPETVQRLKRALKKRGIPLFAEYDHAQNAADAGLSLRPTTVLVFGSPKVGTGLMQADQSLSLELPLRISVWEDEHGSTWLAFPRMDELAAQYGQGGNPAVPQMEHLLEELVREAGDVY